MNGEDDVGEKEIAELEQLTRFMERAVQDFSFSGDAVSGSIEQGYTYNPSIEE